jgi:cell division protein FtsN
VIEHPALRSKTKVWRYVAAACLLPIAFYSFWLPMRTNVLESGMISVKDFNPFYHSEEGLYKQQEQPNVRSSAAEKTLEEQVANLPEDVSVFSYEFDSDLYIPVRIPHATEAPAVEQNSVVQEFSATDASFQFIVGCFGSESNATNLVANLKAQGIDAYIYDESNGLKRISAGGASSEAALQDLISDVKAKGFDGWVLKK